MPPVSATAARRARFWAARRHTLQIIGSIGVVFVGVLEAMALLLWVPRQALFPLALVGLPIGLALGVLEAVVFPALVQRVNLRVATLLQGVAHLLLLGVLYGAFLWVTYLLDLHQLWLPPTGKTPGLVQNVLRVAIIYLFAGSMTTLVRQLLLRMDRQRLMQLLAGHYQQPVSEDRIFLFVDLKGSTRLAETLGNDRYSRFVRDFFADASVAIATTRGEVYQYVGDEVVVTWPAKLGVSHANVLHCFFEMQHRIEERQSYYLRKYGVVPEFKAGAHGGPVTTVLVGAAHRELVYHGDVLNTTARIQAQCNALGSKFLVSDSLYRQLGAQPEYQFTHLGNHQLRGKAGATELVDVQEKAFYQPLHAQTLESTWPAGN
ncbi:adenylate/guanylate cyclase domain-containing protein [Hymenobacter sp. BT186]|uniref:Adenylate/guanylate cyclase domain-containing protein n=1 Tax=Hymenobacter telluris TaxID=2816474 RepID=A0A939JDT4_9BACT|nr:adenylate/guanylate cyclase domain-containing protein [Hymenobacter telluris]MBO0359248.1 adenylate/guanylate cyclase domain-containing protein [Hymenobacter telluris]MBW3375274.1 adenylate/guanylate cyclase domain-containing protein [Hymenobacter norwichensis]